MILVLEKEKIMNNTNFEQIVEPVLFYVVIIALILLARWIKRKRYEKTSYYQETQVEYNEINKYSGTAGESRIFNELDKIEGYHKIVANCYLPKKDGTTSEVDLIMIHEKGIFVIESKDYSGWIFGSYNNKYWTQSLPSGVSSVKYRFYNPIWQNNGHINALNNYVDISNYPIYSYIVFSNRCELMKVTTNPHENVVVINRSQLLQVITNKLKTSEIVIDNKKIDELYATLKQTSKHDVETKNKHISNIK